MNLPDNISHLLGVDFSGNIVSLDASLFSATTVNQTNINVPDSRIPIADKEAIPTSTVTNNIIKQTIENGFVIQADPHFIPLVNADGTNFYNSSIYQSGVKIGINTRAPQYLLHVAGGSINISTTDDVTNYGYKIDGYNIAYRDAINNLIHFGNDLDLLTASFNTLLLRGLIPTTPLGEDRYLAVNDLGVVSATSDVNASRLRVRVRNSTGSTIYKGMIVYMSGSTGNRPNVSLSRANSEATSARTFGAAYADIPNNTDGYVVVIGNIDTLDTRTNAPHPFTTDTLSEGDTLYLSPTNAGYVTNVKPSAPNHLVYVGKVVRTSPTNGFIEYQIQNGFELDELHDVQIISKTNKDFLYYDGALGLWKNSQFDSIMAIGGEVSGTYGNIILSEVAILAKKLTGLNTSSGSAISSTDSIIGAFGKLQAQLNSLQGSLIFKGIWNASTNTPTLASGVGVAGNYYVVGTAGDTTIDGNNDWKAKDWIVFNGTAWDKIDNTDSVTSVNGQAGIVNLTTSNIPEAATPINRYFTEARAIASMIGAISSVTTSNLPINRVLISDGGGKIGASSVTTTELDFLSGTTSSIQSQLGGKEPSIAAGTAPQYWRGDKTWQTLNTSAVVEGVNLYYTEARVNANVNVAANTAARHNAVTLGTANGLSLSTQVLSLGLASSSANGALSSADWTTFNSKQSALTFGNLTEATSSVLTILGGTGAVIGSGASIQVKQASGSQSGFLSSTDWNTFNNKQPAGNYVTLTGVETLSNKTFSNVVNLSVNGFILAGATGVNPLQMYSTTLTSNFLFGSNSFGTNINNDLFYSKDSSNKSVLSFNNTSERTYTFPNASGTLALTSDIPSLAGYVPTTRTITINGIIFNLSANRSWNVGTVTSVSALTIGTSGTDIGSTVATPTTTPTITLNIPTASATNRGALSSADWTTFNSKEPAIVAGTTPQYYRGDKTFQTLNTDAVPESATPTNLYYTNTRVSNYLVGAISPILISNLTASRALISNASGKIAISSVTDTELGYLSGVTSAIQTQLNSKQNALTNPITGSLTTNYIPKATGATTLGNSLIYDTGTNVGIGTNTVLANSGSTAMQIVGLDYPIFTITSSNQSINGRLGVGFGNAYVGTATNHPFLIISNDLERMRITSTGNVLIGTTTDSGYKIDSFGRGRFNSSLYVRSSAYLSNYYTSLRSDSSANGILQLGNNNINYILAGNTSTGGFLAIRVNVSDETLTSGSEAMRILANGNLLVGTTTDNGARLQVNGNGYFSGKLLVGQSSETTTDIIQITGNVRTLGYLYTTDAIREIFLNPSADFGAGANPSIQVTTNHNLQFATNNTQRMVITNTGSVGIGTTAPSYKLDVVGTINATALRITGGTSSQYLMADGSVTTLSATAPLSYNNATGVFSISQANTSTNGFLSSTDWNTFNNKVSASRTLTINGISFDLSADRTWSITTGTVGGVGVTNYAAKWINSTTIGTGAIYDTGTNVSIGNIPAASYRFNIANASGVRFLSVWEPTINGTGEIALLAHKGGGLSDQAPLYITATSFHTPATFVNTNGITGGGALQVDGNVNITGNFQVNGVNIGGGGGGVSNLFQLNDVALSSPTNGQALVYNSSSGKWINSTISSGGGAVSSVFGRTGAVSANDGDYVLNLLGDVTISSPTNGQLLQFNGTNWVNATVSTGGGVNNLFQLLDVNIVSVANDQVLSYNSSTGKWQNKAFVAAPVSSVFGRTGAVVANDGDYTLNLLGDVTISSPSNGQVLQYNGSQWVNASTSTSGVGGSGVTNYIPKWSNTTSLTNSSFQDNGTAITSSVSISAPAFYESSDLRLKNLLSLDSVKDLSSLTPISYTFKSDTENRIRFGYSAQQVRKLMKELCYDDINGYLSISYTDIHTLKIKQLEDRVEELEKQLKLR